MPFKRNTIKIVHRLQLQTTYILIVLFVVACDNLNSVEIGNHKNDLKKENMSYFDLNERNLVDHAVSIKINPSEHALVDGSIIANVKFALLNESGLQLTKINVFSERGVVTLIGSLDSQIKIYKAMELSMAVEGVRSVKGKFVISQ